MDYQQRIRYLALAAVILGFLQVQGQDDPVVTIAPSDVVARKGEHATFFCKITADPKTEAFQWFRTTYGNPEETIFKGFNPKPIDATKYNFTQSKTDPLDTNIVVKNLELIDAGSYKCAPMTETTLGKKAELVVVEKPRISVLDILEDGKPGRIICDAYYLRNDNVDAEAIEPQLFAMIGTQHIPTDQTVTVKTAPTPGDKRYQLSLFYNGTMWGEQHGKNFTCKAMVSRAPIYFTLAVNETLTIKSPTTEAELSEPIQKIYYPGDNINCTANGHPEPKMRWIPIQSNGAGEKNGCMLEITEEMLGNNTWKCRVEQYGNPPVVIDTREIKFEVLTPTEPPAGESTGADPTIIAVAVAIPVAVVLAVLIVVCIVCKKKKAKDAKPKRGDGVEAGTASQKQRNQIYKPVSTNPEGQVRLQEEKASYRAKDSADKGSRPNPAPRQPEPNTEEIA